MFYSRNVFSGKRKYLYGLLLLSFISVICVALSMEDNNDFDISRREVLLRRIGHEILLQADDSVSRVLPVKKIAANEYQISFENPFTFQPGLLVNTTRRLLAKDPLASDYVVNVVNCANSSVVYGYAISKNKKDDIVACTGRRQPIACYMINIKFKPTGITTAKNGYFLGALLLAAFAGFILLRSGKPRSDLPDSRSAGHHFYAKGLLFFQGKNILKKNSPIHNIPKISSVNGLLTVATQKPRTSFCSC